MFKLAVVYALSGQRDKALGWLEQARAQGYSPGLTRDDPDLKSLHNEPRFKALTTSNTR